MRVWDGPPGLSARRQSGLLGCRSDLIFRGGQKFSRRNRTAVPTWDGSRKPSTAATPSSTNTDGLAISVVYSFNKVVWTCVLLDLLNIR